MADNVQYSRGVIEKANVPSATQPDNRQPLDVVNRVRAQVLGVFAEIEANYKKYGVNYWNEVLTEGRMSTHKKYASCGDLWTYVAWRILGSRAWINRKEAHDRWVPGRNVEWIVSEARRLGAFHTGRGARPGDFLLLDRPNGGHAAILVSGEPGMTDYTTGDSNGPTRGIAYNARMRGDVPLGFIRLGDLGDPARQATYSTELMPNILKDPTSNSSSDFDFDEPSPGTRLIAEPRDFAELRPGAVYAEKGSSVWRTLLQG